MKIKELTAKDIKNIMMDKALIIVLVFMIIGIIIIEPSFLQIRVLTDILTQSAVKMICALGLMFALLLGGTDLSGGRQVGLAAVMVASLSQMADYSNKFWPGLPDSRHHDPGSGCRDRSCQRLYDCKAKDGAFYRHIRHEHHCLRH